MEALHVWFTEKEINENHISLRLEELVFNNAGFMARLYTQMAGTLDFESADDHSKVHIMCEAFAVHSVISYFGKKHLEKMRRAKHKKLLCTDNIEQCVNKANGLINYPKFLDLVAFVGGKDIIAIKRAFDGDNRERGPLAD
jgi:hypothetical protein